uniref:Ribosomal RNA small subunit methyltransferase Nep1 n=1 Tax=uncultured marine thaumarchaeote KM3_71_H11 TaxID=1456260 RepID=A0A075HHJ5_9ARCH|nr:ribosome biogenesis protein (NEP1) [uncultured marine thaumarchaeote KM3_71_H11]
MSNLSLVLAESSLEMIPKEIQNHSSVISHSKKLGKLSSNILLDNSWHYAAMKGIQNENKRGRPDIVHFSLLEACSIPLYFEKKLSIYIHTLNDKVIKVGDDVHLPKSFHRFAGLIEKLFYEKKIESDGKKLLEINDMNFSKLIEEINPKNVIGLSSVGKPSSFCDVAKYLSENSCIVIGGFQKSHFSDSTVSKIDQLVSIDSESLESHIVTARILYEYEKTIFK